jgi:AcrR family transcriptional regulator
MEQDKTVRKPKQARSLKTKEKILDAAYQLFCSKGYYKTTTNEIAKVADVSIGSLYSYYKDKDTILLELLERYNDSYIKVNDRLYQDMELYKTDPKTWFRKFMEGMIEVHQISKELNQEMEILCFAMPEVAAVMEKQHEKTRQKALSAFYLYKDLIKVKDTEAAAIVAFNLIDSVVDQIVFCENKISNERILQAGIDAVYKYLMTE